MSFPEFFDRVPPITVIDPLGRFLGAGDGVVTHHYAEAVKLAGHSCPTLAGSWLMLRAGLARLWPGGLPVRGDIHVHLPNEADEGTTGVVAAVASLVTGARGDDGFKGLAGRFDRRGRLHFGTPPPRRARLAPRRQRGRRRPRFRTRRRALATGTAAAVGQVGRRGGRRGRGTPTGPVVAGQGPPDADRSRRRSVADPTCRLARTGPIGERMPQTGLAADQAGNPVPESALEIA